MESIPQAAGRPDVTIRKAVGADAAALGLIHVQTWQSDYRGIVPDDYLAALAVNEDGSLSNDEEGRDYRRMIEDPEILVLVAEDPDDGVIGFSIGGPFRDERHSLSGSFSGELYYIYVVKEYQGRGVGTRLVRATGRGLLDRGMTSMLVWVFEGYRAVSLYERLGAKRVGTREVTLGGRRIADVAYGWEDTNVIMDSR